VKFEIFWDTKGPSELDVEEVIAIADAYRLVGMAFADIWLETNLHLGLRGRHCSIFEPSSSMESRCCRFQERGLGCCFERESLMWMRKLFKFTKKRRRNSLLIFYQDNNGVILEVEESDLRFTNRFFRYSA